MRSTSMRGAANVESEIYIIRERNKKNKNNNVDLKNKYITGRIHFYSSFHYNTCIIDNCIKMHNGRSG